MCLSLLNLRLHWKIFDSGGNNANFKRRKTLSVTLASFKILSLGNITEDSYVKLKIVVY